MAKPLAGPGWVSGTSANGASAEFSEHAAPWRISIPSVKARASIGLIALTASCGVQDEAAPMERRAPFACQKDADCPVGACLAEFGICSRNDGQLTTLLFEVTPQASDPVYGGARFLTVQNVAEAPAAGSRIALNVRPRVPVTGRVLAPPDQASCLSPARSTLPVTLTFTPRERLLGLSVPSYELATTFDASIGVREYIFRGALPPGRYDVYMRPEIAALGEDCRAIPQIFRDRPIGLTLGADDLQLQQPPPSALRLSIPWRDSLEGWRLDMVHPVTGEVLSNRVTLELADVDPATNDLVTTLNYSRVEPDFINLGEELVRLTPPQGAVAGTVLLVRSGLELYAGEGVIGNVSTFGTPVAFEAWVWKKGEWDRPVPGTVSFSALELDQVEKGVLASFEASATVNAQGQVKVGLLPGQYRIRVTPPGVEMVDLGLMAGFESSLTVWPNADPTLTKQAGHVIEVPAAMFLSGRVVADAGNGQAEGLPLRAVEVRASASNPDRDPCPDPSASGEPVSCERLQAPLLQRALARDPFVPRTRSALSESSGQFEIQGLDCGQCEPGAGAHFDLTVRPDIDTGLPWLVRPSIDLYATPDMEEFRVPMPVARPMRVTYGDPVRSLGDDVGTPADDVGVTQNLSGALVRVFAYVDNQSHVVTDPGGLVPCSSVASAEGLQCLESLLQLAEVRTSSEGEFLLLLPPSLE